MSTKSNLRDFQRKKLYQFEESVLEPHSLNRMLTLTECVSLAQKYNPTIDVRDGRGRRHAGASYEDNLITLPRWSRQTIIVLHEVAHTLVDDQEFPYHGAEFVGLFIGLLAQESIGDIDFNIAAATVAGLSVNQEWIYLAPIANTRR